MYNVIIAVLIFSSILSFSIAIFAFKKNEQVSTFSFSMLMLACSIHAFGYAFELNSRTLNELMFWVRFEYVGISFFPFLLVWLTYTQKNDESFKNNLLLLLFFSVSLTTLFMVQTNAHHGLYYQAFSLDVSGPISYINIDKNLWYHVHSLFTLLAFFIVVGHTRTLYKKSTEYYKKRAMYTLVSLIIPLLGGIIYVLGFTPNQLDILPFIYAPVGLIWFFTVHKYGVFDWMPITYKKVFQQISEGVIVIDNRGSVVDYNLSAYEIFKPIKLISKGMNIDGLLEIIDFKANNNESTFVISQENMDYTYELTLSMITGTKENPMGKIMVVKDISQEAAAKALLEELARKDALTGIHNRRYFFELCNHVIQKARLLNKSVSFVLMDIDYFKKVNDTYGHLAGDLVLKEVTRLCKKILRNDDVIGRYGGEEFAILIYDLSSNETERIIERMGKIIREHKFYISKDQYIHITVSFGIYRPDLDVDTDIHTITNKADKGLYKAKNKGRDCLVIHKEHLG